MLILDFFGFGNLGYGCQGCPRWTCLVRDTNNLCNFGPLFQVTSNGNFVFTGPHSVNNIMNAFLHWFLSVFFAGKLSPGVSATGKDVLEPFTPESLTSWACPEWDLRKLNTGVARGKPHH